MLKGINGLLWYIYLSAQIQHAVPVLPWDGFASHGVDTSQPLQQSPPAPDAADTAEHVNMASQGRAKHQYAWVP